MISFNILSLKRRVDRRNVMAGSFQTLGVPFNRVKFHDAPDAMEYTTTDEICDAAIADGFPIFEKMRRSHRGNRGTIACFWGACRILRYIASEEHPYEFGYYNQDDIILKITYSRLIELIQYLKEYTRERCKTDFLILQMHKRYEKPYVELVNKDPIFPGSYIQQGIYSKGEIGLVLSKKGAKYLLEKTQIFGGSLEGLMIALEPDLPGLYSFSRDIRFYALETFNTKFWGLNCEDDQDRIRADRLGG